MGDTDILLVEDNENDAELTIWALQKNNIASHIDHVKDGPEALDYIFGRGNYTIRHTQVLPKMILLDLKLPKLNGLEVLKEIKSSMVTKKIPVVMFSSSQDINDISSAYLNGANSYIVKPVEFDKFSDTIRKLGQYWMGINQSMA